MIVYQVSTPSGELLGFKSLDQAMDELELRIEAVPGCRASLEVIELTEEEWEEGLEE